MIQPCLFWGLGVLINLGVSMGSFLRQFLRDLAQIFNHPPRPHRGTRLLSEAWSTKWRNEWPRGTQKLAFCATLRAALKKAKWIKVACQNPSKPWLTSLSNPIAGLQDSLMRGESWICQMFWCFDIETHKIHQQKWPYQQMTWAKIIRFPTWNWVLGSPCN